jgi:hypothetical protein
MKEVRIAESLCKKGTGRHWRQKEKMVLSANNLKMGKILLLHSIEERGEKETLKKSPFHGTKRYKVLSEKFSDMIRKQNLLNFLLQKVESIRILLASQLGK